jgi:hypothetical protein
MRLDIGRTAGRVGVPVDAGRRASPLVLALMLALMLAVSVAACHGTTEVPEPGATLVRVKLGAGATMPDELRVFVYDDSGALWDGVRLPAEGTLVPESATTLGTILIDPGVTVGDLRVDLRGLAAGLLVDEGTLSIPPAARVGGTFDVTLEAALPADSDGDGIPDPVDDCPSVADPKQMGCRADADAATARSDASTATDAAADARSDAARTDGAGGREDGASGRADAASGRADAASGRVDAAPDARADAPRDVRPESKARGVGCGAASECASGFCKDGVCCKTACTALCNSCATGECTEVKSADDVPECTGLLTCNKNGKCVLDL